MSCLLPSPYVSRYIHASRAQQGAALDSLRSQVSLFVMRLPEQLNQGAQPIRALSQPLPSPSRLCVRDFGFI
ncbi:MAG: hypothetical protein M0R49_12990, partial [Limnochordia bacterium]|nr:hypothetical protein [Limnochordia bacterium]